MPFALVRCFPTTETAAPTHSWARATHDSTIAPANELAKELADRIMALRCGSAVHHFRAWKARAENGTPLPPTSELALRQAFIGPAFGLPAPAVAVPPDHLQGLIAQYLWFFITSELLATEQIVRIELPGFTALDHGGDGLCVHRTVNGALMFRLWEIKKVTGTSTVNAAVERACAQLDTRAAEYLARFMAIGELLPDPELAAFYGQLVDLWLAAGPEAAAGVSVATSVDLMPADCFTTLGQHFPRYTNPVRLRGLLTGLDDFVGFSQAVRDQIWTGL